MLPQGYLWFLLTELAVPVNMLDFLVPSELIGLNTNYLSVLDNHLQDPVKDKGKSKPSFSFFLYHGIPDSSILLSQRILSSPYA